MFVQFKSRIKSLVAIAVGFVLALTVVACSSPGGILPGNNCLSDEQIYTFSEEYVNGTASVDENRIVVNDVAPYEIIEQFSSIGDCASQTITTNTSLVTYEMETDGVDYMNGALMAEALVDWVCSETHRSSYGYNGQDTDEVYANSHHALTYLSVTSYLKGGPLYHSIQCEGMTDEELDVTYPEMSARLSYTEFVQIGRYHGVLE